MVVVYVHKLNIRAFFDTSVFLNPQLQHKPLQVHIMYNPTKQSNVRTHALCGGSAYLEKKNNVIKSIT